MFDLYKCEDCKATFNNYTRFCPECDGEKSLKLEENGLIKNILENLICITSEKTLNDLIEITTGENIIDMQDLIKFIKEKK